MIRRALLLALAVALLVTAPAATAGTPTPRVRVVTITAAQLRAADSAPVLIIPAPGPGNAIFVTSAFIQMGAGTGYSGGGGVWLHYAGWPPNDGVHTFGEGIFQNVSPGTTAGFFPDNPTQPAFPAPSDLDNAAVVLSADGPVAAGTANLRLTVTYVVVDVSAP